MSKDFKVPGYLNNARIVKALESLELAPDPASIGGNMRRCYVELVNMGIVPEKELSLVDEWLSALQIWRAGASGGRLS